MSSSHIPTRAEIPESDKWDLTQLFTDVGKWQEDFAWLQRTYPKLENWKGRVGESAQTLAEVLEFEKSLELKIERVYHYASLQLAENSTNNEYLARIGQVQNLLTKIGEAGAFIVPEIQAIDNATFATDGRGHEVRRLNRRDRSRGTAYAKFVQFVSGEARSGTAQARLPSILRGISGPSVHARSVTRLLGQGGRVSGAR